MNTPEPCDPPSCSISASETPYPHTPRRPMFGTSPSCLPLHLSRSRQHAHSVNRSLLHRTPTPDVDSFRELELPTISLYSASPFSRPSNATSAPPSVPTRLADYAEPEAGSLSSLQRCFWLGRSYWAPVPLRRSRSCSLTTTQASCRVRRYLARADGVSRKSRAAFGALVVRARREWRGGGKGAAMLDSSLSMIPPFLICREKRQRCERAKCREVGRESAAQSNAYRRILSGG